MEDESSSPDSTLPVVCGSNNDVGCCLTRVHGSTTCCFIDHRRVGYTLGERAEHLKQSCVTRLALGARSGGAELFLENDLVCARRGCGHDSTCNTRDDARAVGHKRDHKECVSNADFLLKSGIDGNVGVRLRRRPHDTRPQLAATFLRGAFTAPMVARRQ